MCFLVTFKNGLCLFFPCTVQMFIIFELLNNYSLSLSTAEKKNKKKKISANSFVETNKHELDGFMLNALTLFLMCTI